jgi:MtN3 and saliva related transmembrane protein
MIMEYSVLYSSSLLAFIIGVAATVLTRYSSIPQIIKGFKTKKMDDVSFWLIFYLTVGLFLYVIYGIIINDLIIIWGNVIGVISNLILIILKIKYSIKSFE